MDGFFLNGCPNVDSEFRNTINNTSKGNVAKSWQWRQLGMNPKGSASNKRILQEAAEDHLVNKETLSERCCEVPGVPRSTFLMVFSPDGTKVASTHGNHNVYVSELATGKHVKTLSGHPRTPWCIAFHPSHTQLLGSGCLGGEVRVWDLSGGSEVWTVSSETVIASIAFHPRDQLLVIATYNELYFWDWSQPQPFTKVQTNTIKEKVRFVSFDALGHKLITGISVWSVPGSQPAQTARPEPPSATDQTATYHQLLDRYNSLVRNYRRLIMAQTHSATTTDRGTDPMETDWATERASTSLPPTARPRLPPRTHHSDAPVSFSSRTDPWSGGSTLPGPSVRMTYAASPSPSSSSVPLHSDGLFSPAAGGSRQSAFRPVTETRGHGPSPVDGPSPSHRTLDVPSTAAGLTARLRGELTASLGRLQYFMEHSIDETLNFRERRVSGVSPLYQLHWLYERTRSRVEGVPDNTPQRAFRPPPAGERDRFRSDHNDLPENAGASPSTTGGGSRAGLFSSDDGSDSDREMFSPLPLHIYRTRNWSAPTDATTGAFSVGSTVELPSRDAEGRETVAEGTPRREASESLERLRRRYLSPQVGAAVIWGPPQQSTQISSDSERGVVDAGGDVVMETEPPRPPVEGLRPDVNAENVENERRSNEAFQKVILGVQAIQRHTESLIALCSENASRPPLLRLRRHWEDLRRDMIRMHRPSFAVQGPPNYFSLSARQRCDLVSAPVHPRSDTGASSQTGTQSSDATCSCNPPAQPTIDNAPISVDNNSDNIQNREETNRPPDTVSQISNQVENNELQDLDSPSTSTGIGRTSRGSRVESTVVGRDRDRRRRLRAVVMNGISRGLSGMRRTIRSIRIQRRYRIDRVSVPSSRRDLEPTRDSVRLHARRVLSIMFSIMMQCLDTDRLGSQIIAMLKSLKRALGLSSLLLATPPVTEGNRPADTQRRNDSGRTEAPTTTRNDPPRRATPSWSDRVAVQISAANRNNSSNARHRRETYHKIIKARALRACQPLTLHFSSNREPTRLPSEGEPSETVTSGPSNERSEARETSGEVRPTETRRDASLARIHSRLFLRRFFYNRNRAGDATGPSRPPENRQREPTSDAEMSNFSNRPIHLSRIIYGISPIPGPEYAEAERAGPSSNVVVPAVRINDVPVYDVFPNVVPLRRRLASGIVEYLQQNNVLTIDENDGVGIIDAGPSLVSETSASPVHRIQAWDFAEGRIPDISDANQNIVVHKCKIHNDASIDISRDGRLLVALLPSQRLRNITHRLGIYSLDWNCLGECLYTALLEQNAVSVSLSPCARHLAVGLGSRRVSLQLYGRNSVMALIFRLGPLQKNDSDTRSGLILIRRLEQSWDLGFTSLNCLRWAPQPGQGLVYANNTGQLKILS